MAFKCSRLPCCRERTKAPRTNQYGAPVPRSIDDPLSGYEDEDDQWPSMGWHESSGTEVEVDEAPVTFERKRAKAVSAEVYGACNPRRAFVPPVHEKTPEQESILREAFSRAVLFRGLASEDLDPIVEAIEVQTYEDGRCICQQGDPGDALFVMLSGEVDLFKDKETQEPDPDFLRTLKQVGTIFGELALLWNMPRSLTVKANASNPCMVGRLAREVFQHLVIQCEMNKRELRQQSLRHVKELETLDGEQIAKLADALELKTYSKGDKLITQGELGADFFILHRGECVAIVETYFLAISVDEQEVFRYKPGDLFGERALRRNEPRAASILASDDVVQALVMRRVEFERLLGPLTALQENQYLTDPRKLIADFYFAGDSNGPAGSMLQQGKDAPRKSVKDAAQSTWFCVYRPTSRDAIAKMISEVAVGKGLNVKGKSAKKGVLSGFVPFLQISDNDHKDKIESSPSDSRVTIYYRNASSRETALAALYSIMYEAGAKLEIDDKKVKMVDTYKPNVYGLDVPEALIVEAYIKVPDIVPRVGWETGRASEPAFMDMNLHAVRGQSEPQVALYQFDEGDPMNCRGVLIAYAEKLVKPVVSDFDTFTIGSKNITYEPLPANQAQLAKWSLNHAKDVLENPGDVGWTSRWLEILKKEAEQGFHPEFPKYGFGDPTSYRLIGDVVTATLSCGAVRHGAECFNFYFPQELDTDYLVVWEGFPDAPWDYKDEKMLRQFLMERIEDDFVFPLNPVWPVRDKGWYQVLQALKNNPVTCSSLAAWDPPGAGILDAIEEIYAANPNGFVVQGQEQLCISPSRTRSTADMFGNDVMGCEAADLGSFQIKRHVQFRKTVGKVKMMNALGKPMQAMPTRKETNEPNDETKPKETKIDETKKDETKKDETKIDETLAAGGDATTAEPDAF